MLIILGSDDRYAMPLAVTIHSLLKRVAPTAAIEVLVMDAGISRTNRTRIEHVVEGARPGTELRWIHPDMSEFERMRTTHWGSPASYLPLLTPTLAKESDYALYLDSDLLIQHDVSELWKDTPVPTPVHAVLDYGFHTLGEALKDNAAERLGLDSQAPYFNSGVLLINLEVWRTRGIAEQAMRFAQDNPNVMRFTDQDALNAVLQGDWQPLDPHWNVLIGSIEQIVSSHSDDDEEKARLRRSLTETPYIMHFSGSQKPWKPGYSRLNQTEYLDELRGCGWFDRPSDYTRWRTRMMLGSPLATVRRKTIRAAWPVIERVRKPRK